ncbi:hypothetical protein TWF706_002581 [Orbilia oligospora]|nr:hypothetical protein TWF706_002581 [Orbilia oligospora]
MIYDIKIQEHSHLTHAFNSQQIGRRDKRFFTFNEHQRTDNIALVDYKSQNFTTKISSLPKDGQTCGVISTRVSTYWTCRWPTEFEHPVCAGRHFYSDYPLSTTPARILVAFERSFT